MSLSLDTSHSSVEFAVRHMGLATVRGRFTEFEVDAKLDEAGVPTSIVAKIDAASITTGNDGRDAHLRGADFFDTEAYPTIVFESTNVVRRGEEYAIEGNLTIKDVAKPVTFNTQLTDFVTDPWGNPRVAAEATGKINRTDWGLTWNQVLEAGALLVSEDVRFTIAVQMVKQAEVAA